MRQEPLSFPEEEVKPALVVVPSRRRGVQRPPQVLGWGSGMGLWP